MRIESLEIVKLHNLYDYNVRFNPDLTFLYGSNGCGKTTILNIIEAIISGRIYDLFNWEFEQIHLGYIDENSPSQNPKDIQITYKGKDIGLSFNGRNKTLHKDDFIRYSDKADSSEELFDLMASKHVFLMAIKEEFNYVYLPLNRNTGNSPNTPLYQEYFRQLRFSYLRDYVERNFTREDGIEHAADLVQKSFLEASVKVSTINDEFRNSVLKSLLTTNKRIPDDEPLNFFLDSASINELNSLKNQYFKLLESFDLLNDMEKSSYNQFFQEYKSQVDNLQSILRAEGNASVLPSLIYNYHEIEKMKTVIPLAQEAEEKKAEALKKFSLFEETMNSFTCLDEGDKQLSIDDTGKIQFFTNGKDINISVSNLSSGEKQLLIFFANLVFKVDESQSSIFVVDEPELSLHLSWQKMFVDKAMRVNQNMQLILATHAPEIVGSHRDKMVKLVKKLHDVD